MTIPEAPSLVDDQQLRTAVAQAVQQAGDNPWLAADYVLVGPVAALVARARADGIEEGRGDMEHLERKWRAEERERIVALAFGQAQRIDGSWIDPDGSRAMAQALVSFAHDVDHGAVAGEGTDCQDSTVDHLTEWIGGRT